MAKARVGSRVRVQYTGRLENGAVFDTSPEDEPLEFTIGEGQVIPGFEQAVVGMKPGESKTAQVAPEKAYGPHHEELVVAVRRKQLPEQIEPQVGQRLEVRRSDGGSVTLSVTDVSDSTVTLDGNHPLAGHELTFDIELMAIT